MKLLVTGAGRGGTNLAIELVRNMNKFSVTANVEDRGFFNKSNLPDLYATKLATENKGFNVQNIKKMMDENHDLYVLFVVRNPIDNCLSKILRGRPKSMGGDSTVNEVSPDATINGSIAALNHMYSIFKFLKEEYPKRFIWFKMENLINTPESIAKEICYKLNMPYKDKMLDFYKTNRNHYQKKRYGNKLHNQIELYKDLDNNFDGYFKNNKDYPDKLKHELEKLLEGLNYE